MPARLTGQSANLLQLMEQYQRDHLQPGSYGACASFIGSMRDFNAGDNVQSMTLEHYPEMTQRFLDQLCEQALAKWDLVDCLVVHRYGELTPGEPIVLTAAWSAHREDAFEACRFLIEQLKSKAPFWKKENTDKGERWVHEADNTE